MRRVPAEQETNSFYGQSRAQGAFELWLERGSNMFTTDFDCGLRTWTIFSEVDRAAHVFSTACLLLSGMVGARCPRSEPLTAQVRSFGAMRGPRLGP